MTVELRPAGAYRVAEAFDIVRLLGVAESQTYIGRSMALSNVWAPVHLESGAWVLFLPGGTFAMGADHVAFGEASAFRPGSMSTDD